MKNHVFYLLLLVSPLSHAQVGIGTNTPKAFFNVIAGQTVIFGQDSNQVGSDRKLIWYGGRGAFRVGGVADGSWSRASASDYTNIGQFSFASGYNTKASNVYTTALGYQTTASSYTATAMGKSTTASGEYAIAIGSYNTASNYYTIAIGNSNIASGLAAIAIGSINTIASGDRSMAIGNNSTASGDRSTSMGNNVSTNGQTGSFIIGDNAAYTFSNTENNQMMMRFSGGYRLYSSDPSSQSSAIGVQLATGSNAWQTLSDSTRKEKFLSADGSSFLQKIARMRLGSWNYKGQDARLYRHYGPMAQDFFAAFGRDELGTIGEDKSINQADFDGVNLIAIQALIKKVEKLEAENAALSTKNTQVESETASLRSDVEQLKKQMAGLVKQ